MKHHIIRSKCKRCLACLLLLVLGITHGWAQSISVTDFYLDQKDLQANDRATSVLDQNGEKCAIIKVQTTQKNFNFDVGSAGITKTDYSHPGEVWLYVPWGIKHIKITHSLLGSLPNYDFPVPIQRARTYVMVITSDKVFTNTYDDTYKQRLLIRVPKVNPFKTIVTLNGMNVALNNKGEAERTLALGTYTYKVDAEGFYPKESQITIDDTLKAQTLIIDDLKPIMGKLNVLADPPSATIKLNGNVVDSLSSGRTINLQVGRYKVELSAEGYRSEQVEVNVEKGQTARLSVPLTQVATFRITSSPSNAYIRIGSDYTGSTPCNVELRTDNYEITASKKGYKDFHKVLNLKCSDPKLHVRLNRIFNYRNEFYIEPSFMFGQFTAIGGTVGAYIKNINIEAFYYAPMGGETEKIYWAYTDKVPAAWGDRDDTPKPYTYKGSMALGGRVGYGFALGTRLRLTPQVGFQFVKTHATVDTPETVYCADGAYATSIIASARLSVALANHIGLNIAPGYAFAVTQSDGFKKLADISSDFKKFGTGLNIRAGVYVFF